MRTLRLTILSIFIAISSILKAQLTTTNTLTPQQLVQQVLLGQGVTASNINYTGKATAIGKFNATASTNIGIPSGIIMSSGNAIGTTGPSGNVSGSASTDHSLPGDTDLDNIINDTYDAAVLEFDFVPIGDSLSFKYVFASDEYPNYVCSSYADVFAYLVSGANPAGGTYNNFNIATIPGTNLPVSINSINSGSPGSGYQASGCLSTAYSSLYVSNQSPANTYIKYNGMSKVLTAKIAVICGQTYHIKIAIADVSDGTLDSGVFLEAGSFSSAPPISVNTSNSNAAVVDTLFYEDCNTYCVKFVRNNNIAVKDSFMLNVGGAAINGTDYGTLTGTVVSNYAWPNKIVFEPNQDTIKLCGIRVFDDATIEGFESLSFTVAKYTSSATSCIQTNTVSFSVFLSDYTPIHLNTKDSTICNSTSITLKANESLGTPPYTYSWSPSGITTNSLTTPIITQPSTFTITVNDICDKPISKQIIVTPTTLPQLSEVNPIKFCLDSIKQIPITVTGGKPNYFISWIIPAGGIAPYDTVGTTYFFTQTLLASSGDYSVVVNDQCNMKDTIRVNITTSDCKIIVPNVLTLNGDNINETFRINGLDNFDGSNLFVFNRWGDKIYSSNNYKNDWKPDVNPGTYYYVVLLSDGRKLNGFFQVFN